ncbi:MAG: hypothetical protein GVY36_19990 [Verrucomicrobia bacterium]|jgi:hypothetical protein|nr:hypothetical protein [Verrucomicrobiota bacterium]
MALKASGSPPKVEMASADPLQDYYQRGGNLYSVARIVDEAKDLTPFDVPVASLDVSGVPFDELSLLEMAWHCRKVVDADLRYPIILDWDGCVADGRHRIVRALMDGRKTIKAVRLQHQMTPCSVEDE